MAAKLQFADLEQVGPDSPAGQYLRRFWHPIMRVQDLPRGRAKPVELLSEKFTLYRGESGTPHLCAFRCAHRGTQLSLGWVEGDTLRCRYHGWKFDAAGQCVEQPNEDRPFCDRVKIASYPTREYLGLVFVYVGPDEPPALPRYPDLDRPGVLVNEPEERIPCNFWNRLDNDIAHIPWVHRATALRKGRNDFIVQRREAVDETPYGWRSTRYARGETTGLRDTSGNAHFFMPTVYQFGVRTRLKGYEGRDLWDTKITWTVPINDKAFSAFDVVHTPLDGEEAATYAARHGSQMQSESEDRWDLAEKVLAGEMTLEELPPELSANTCFAIEDYVTQVGQGPIAGRGREQMAATDAKVLLMRRLWLREVTALMEGKNLTEWKIPAEPVQQMATA